MEFLVLGPLALRWRGEARPLTSAKQRVLLGALLVEPGRVVTTDRLIDLLWGETPPPSARNSLQTYVARLRTELAELDTGQLLITRGPGYALDISPDQLDAARFEDLLARARASSDPAETVRRLDEALGLWRGPAFAELADHEFTRGAALRLEELRLAALHARVDARLELGQLAEAIADLEDAVTAQPLRERPHEQLVRALAASGRTAEALAVVREFRDRLADEVGLDPSPRLVALERDVLQQAPGLVPAADPPAADAAAMPPLPDNRLPGSATSLVGRDADLDRLERTSRQSRLVTVTGPGGVGKTRLALEAARRRNARDAIDSRLCELGPVDDAAAVAHAVATAAGLATPPGQPVELTTVVDALRERELLLVVDGCEHLLDALAHLAHAVLRHCPGVEVLATSRERLGVHGEHVVPLGPLPVPAAGDPDVADAPAVRLFVDRARAVRPAFRLSDDNAEAVAEVCRRLDGLPLAIELAAARTGALEPGDLATRLDERFALLESGWRAGEPRHRTLRAVVDWSYQLLDETERRVFERVSAFAGGFTLSLAEQVVAGDGVPGPSVAALIAGLVDKSMVVASHATPSPRYTLLETLRDYGRECLAHRDEAEQVARAHAVAVVDLAERAAVGLTTRAEGEWIARLDEELDNFRAAHRWATAAGDADLTLRLTAALHRYGYWRLRREVFDWAEAAVGAPWAVGHPALPRARVAAGVAAWMRGDLDAAAAHARQGLTTAAGDDPGTQALLWEVAGDVATFQGRVDDAVANFTEASRLAEAAGDTQTAVINIVSQALARAYGGDTRQGLALATVAHERAARSRNPTSLAWGLYTRGEVLGLDDPERALPLLDDARELAESVGNEFVVGITDVSAASLRSRLGDPAEALRGFAALIDRWRQGNNWTQQWTTLRNLVELLVRLGADEPAAVLHAAATAPEAGGRSYGAEAARLHAAAATAYERLGPQRYESASERGRRLGAHDVLRVATETIDGLRAELPSPRDRPQAGPDAGVLNS